MDRQQSTLPPSRSAEERLEDLERLIGHVLERAREHPVGRKILAVLGLS